MAPTTTTTPTPTPKPNRPFSTPSRTTPLSKHRLNFNPPNKNTTNPSSPPQINHPIEVITRIRNHPNTKDPNSNPNPLQISSDQCNIRVQTEIGYRDFTLDGVSVSEEEDLDGFYKKFVKSRINGVKLGEKCTVMMYGPTGSGKSHTMFGCQKQPGIVYRALRDILGEVDEDGVDVGFGMFVQVSVLEIYNEEIYDLLGSNSGGGFGFGWQKGSASKAKLEVMGKKAKNATFLSGNEAGKLSREVAKVEKRRIVKSTLCNERSSRSHCMIILDVPTVGGRLMLVDMAGSENIDQAGQVGFEAKLQTGKINQGNIALKRVVESIANGDSHVPFRDSKLTMLLQDSFEDDKSKILMILCASPDPKEMHKTISTLEYGAKAKCIVRAGHTPNKDKVGSEDGSAVILGSRIAAMDEFIMKLQLENKRREKERNDAHNELMKKEEEVSALRARLELMEKRKPIESEEEINLKVKEREEVLKLELEKKMEECKKMTDEFVEMGRRRMEEKIQQQQEELVLLRNRLQELESELHKSRDDEKVSDGDDGSSFAKRLMDLCEGAGDHQCMEKSMEMDIEDNNITVTKPYLTTIEEEDDEKVKEVVEEHQITTVRKNAEDTAVRKNADDITVRKNAEDGGPGLLDETARRTRIQNIFLLCGNHRELGSKVPTPCKRKMEEAEICLPLKSSPAPEFGRKVLSERNMKISPIAGMNNIMMENSVESPLKRSRVSLELNQDLEENNVSF